MVGFEVGRKLRQQFVREGVALASTKQSGGPFVGKAATGGNPVIRTKQGQLEFISGCFCF